MNKFGVVKIGLNSGSEGVACKDKGYLSLAGNSALIFDGSANFKKT